ncbi:hypothetical protein BDF19DRAFT_419912 [Syncephalis fuscata]|nr:hypothetical protein BDF19DRAFT_419912 [Syncephalis fuscata]
MKWTLSSTTISLAVLASLVSFNVVTDALDPSTVSTKDRQYWCLVQKSSCTNICRDKNAGTKSNSCDNTNLNWSCVCDNGFQPNGTTYAQTIPFFICQRDQTQCIQNCKNSDDCVEQCRKQFYCAATDPQLAKNGTNTTTDANTTSTSTPSPSVNPTFDDAAIRMFGVGFETISYGIVASAVTVMAIVAGV